MKLTILGSGTAVPSKERFSSSYLIEAGGKRLLADCSATAVARLAERNIDFGSIDAVAVTHFHPDHFAGLLPFVQARYVGELQVRPVLHRPLALFGPPSLRQRWHKLREVMWVEPNEFAPLSFFESDEPCRIGTVVIQPFPVRHVEWFPSYGYRFSHGAASLVYTGDAGPVQEDRFFEMIAGADCLLIEAAARQPGQTHLTVEQAIEIGQRSGAKKTVLTHLRDNQVTDAQAIASRYASQDIEIATDGMEIVF
ncbi:MAG: ribonuclease Z [Planctomycetaceae bacterium]|nr:ribonuclease Z [Planctomycetaceae bacterium]